MIEFFSEELDDAINLIVTVNKNIDCTDKPYIRSLIIKNLKSFDCDFSVYGILVTVSDGFAGFHVSPCTASNRKKLTIERI